MTTPLPQSYIYPLTYLDGTYFNQTSLVSGTTLTMSAAAAPNGRTEAATSVASTTSWFIAYRMDLPVGTYTLACNVMRNTGSDQVFKLGVNVDGTPTQALSAEFTATSAWQRFSFTFTSGSGQNVGLIASSATTADLLIANVNLYAGSSDLGAEDTALTHMQVGPNAYDRAAKAPRHPTFTSNYLHYDGTSNTAVPIATTRFDGTASTANFTFLAVSRGVFPGGTGTGALHFGKNDLSVVGVLNFSGRPVVSWGATSVEWTGGFRGTGQERNMGWHVLGFRFSNTTGSFLYDGSIYDRSSLVGQSTTFAGVPGFPPSAQAIKEYYLGCLFFSQASALDVAAMAFWPRALTDTEVRQATATMQRDVAAYGITLSPTRLLAVEGDSIDLGLDAANGVDNNWDTYYMEIGTKPTMVTIFSEGGNTLQQWQLRKNFVKNMIPPSNLVSGNKRILVVGGVNDAAIGPYAWCPGADLAARRAFWQNAMIAYWDEMRAAGFTVVAHTTTGGAGVEQTIMDPFIRAQSAHYDALIDFAADPNIGPYTAVGNPTYFVTGGPHLTNVGQNLAGTIAQPVFDSL